MKWFIYSLIAVFCNPPPGSQTYRAFAWKSNLRSEETTRFEARIKVRLLNLGITFTVQEQVLQNSEVMISLDGNPDVFATKICSYNDNTGFGHVVRGIACEPRVDLPRNCFMENQTYTYYPMYKIMEKATMSEDHEEEIQDLNGTIENFRFHGLVMKTATGFQPLKISIESNDNSAQTSLEYTVLSFGQESFAHQSGLFPTPPGIYCDRPNFYRRSLPDLPNVFSIKLETEAQNSVAFSEHLYDISYSLVAFKLASESVLSDFSLLSTEGGKTKFKTEPIVVVNDFQSGTQYKIVERNGNCSVTKLSRPDEKEFRDQIDRIKHASFLVDVDPNDFVFSGKRQFRNIACNVWIAEKFTVDNYHTIELFFSESDLDFNRTDGSVMKEVLVGMKVYRAQQKNAASFKRVTTTNFFDFNPNGALWHEFVDLTGCVDKNNRLFLKFTLDTSFNHVPKFDPRVAKESLASLIGDMAGVSPLRIVDIHLSASRPVPKFTTQHPSGIDVWFVLLGQAVEESGSLRLADAYRQLAKAISSKETPVKIKTAQTKTMSVKLRASSLQMSSASIHPTSSTSLNDGDEDFNGSPPFIYLRASYTAGSMAGLGFSMAILGVCIGIFLGFLLWKRRIGLPPSYISMSHHHNHHHPSGFLMSSSHTEQSLGNPTNSDDLIEIPITPPPRY